MYKCGQWAYFVNKEEEKKDEIGLLRSIFKNEKYDVISKQVYKEGETKKKYTKTYFLKNLNLKEKMN